MPVNLNPDEASLPTEPIDTFQALLPPAIEMAAPLERFEDPTLSAASRAKPVPL
jgi:hypothetical protein